MSLIDLVQQQLGSEQIQQISQQIGADPSQTQTAVQAAVPMLLGGMAGAAQQPGGAQGVSAAIDQHASALGGLGGMLGGGGLGSILSGALGGGGGGGGILGSILGRHETQVTDGVQQASGLDSGQVKKLLMVLAPIVLAALARKRQQQAAAPTPSSADLNGDGIPDALQQEAREAQAHAERTSPHIGGIVGKILDAATRH